MVENCNFQPYAEGAQCSIFKAFNDCVGFILVFVVDVGNDTVNRVRERMMKITAYVEIGTCGKAAKDTFSSIVCIACT